MNRVPRLTLSPRFLEPLVDKLDPHQSHVAQEIVEAQVSSSRWLAQRRLWLGLSVADLAARAALPTTSLALLEAGLADRQLLSSDDQRRLAYALGIVGGNEALALEIVGMAVGRVESYSAQLVQQVLDALGPPELVAEEEDAPAMPAPALPLTALKAQQQLAADLNAPVPQQSQMSDEMFAVLGLLAQGARPTYALLEESGFTGGPGSFAYLLDTLLKRDWIERAARSVEQRGGPVRQIYNITDTGYKLYFAEEAFREMRAARHSGDGSGPLPSGSARI